MCTQGWDPLTWINAPGQCFSRFSVLEGHLWACIENAGSESVGLG